MTIRSKSFSPIMPAAANPHRTAHLRKKRTRGAFAVLRVTPRIDSVSHKIQADNIPNRPAGVPLLLTGLPKISTGPELYTQGE